MYRLYSKTSVTPTRVFSGRGVTALKSCDSNSSSTKIVRFFGACTGRDISSFRFDLKKFRCFDENVRFAAVRVERENRVMRICEARKSYEVFEHVSGDIFPFSFISNKFHFSEERGGFVKFILYLRKIPLRRREH